MTRCVFTYHQCKSFWMHNFRKRWSQPQYIIHVNPSIINSIIERSNKTKQRHGSLSFIFTLYSPNLFCFSVVYIPWDWDASAKHMNRPNWREWERLMIKVKEKKKLQRLMSRFGFGHSIDRFQQIFFWRFFFLFLFLLRFDLRA